MKLTFVIVFLFALASCQASKSVMPEGEQVAPPLGQYSLCKNQPESFFCKK